VVNNPFFYHSITGIKLTKRKLYIFAFLGAAMLANSIYYLVTRTEISFIILKAPLHLVNLYGVVFFIGNYNNIGNRQIKKYLLIFFIITLLFLPYFLIDGIVLKLVLGFPVYNIIINIIALFFTLHYFNQPNYLENNKITDYFKKTFPLTVREMEIVDKIILGLNNTEIGNQLFISPKTVENHLYNIYSKIGIKNRYQLFSLIISNSDISRPEMKADFN
jgi:DNA-binding CsgD family transcriptional regulator